MPDYTSHEIIDMILIRRMGKL